MNVNLINKYFICLEQNYLNIIFRLNYFEELRKKNVYSVQEEY